MPTEQQANDVKRQHSRQLMSRPGVAGVGVEKDPSGDYVLAVHVDPAHPDAAANLPKVLDGLTVKVYQSGPFTKQS
jgi:hypothetical protein